jgi:uncharacterized membrane protein
LSFVIVVIAANVVVVTVLVLVPLRMGGFADRNIFKKKKKKGQKGTRFPLSLHALIDQSD